MYLSKQQHTTMTNKNIFDILSNPHPDEYISYRELPKNLQHPLMKAYMRAKLIKNTAGFSAMQYSYDPFASHLHEYIGNDNQEERIKTYGLRKDIYRDGPFNAVGSNGMQ
jgi:hypothetical protein